MKTTTLPIIAFVAAIAAVALVPVSPAAACILVTVTGLLATLAADYGPRAAPARVQAPVLPFTPQAEAAGDLAA